METTTSTTTELNIEKILETINISSDILSYNASIIDSIQQNSGIVIYSYNNIIIASNISDELLNELQKNPNIEYIQNLPLQKYGSVDYSLINQLDIQNL
jgi:hypothetical protein